jgi:hypothetical protein
MPSGPDSATLVLGNVGLVFAAILVGRVGSEALESTRETREGPGLETLWLSSAFFSLKAASFLNYRRSSANMIPKSTSRQPTIIKK